MKKEWTDRLRDRLSEYEESVPEGLWEDIESTLSARMETAGVSEKRKTGTMLRRIIIAATAAAAAVVILLIPGKGDDITRVKPMETARATDNGSMGAAGTTHMENATGTTARVHTAHGAQETHVADGVEYTEMSPESGVTECAEDISETRHDGGGQQRPVNGDGEKGGKAVNRTKTNTQPHIYNVPERHERNAGRRVSLGLYAQNANLLAMNEPSQNAPFQDSPQANTPGNTNTNEFQNIQNSINAQYNTMTKTTKHDLPIRTGISLHYRLTDRIGIESGLTYTMLKSRISSGNEYIQEDTRRQLHYIGIPLNVSCTVWQGKGIEAYVSGGGEIQKCVAGKDRTKSTMNEPEAPPSIVRTKDSRLQLSVNTAAGIQYNISPVIGIYAEPGLSWYPDNGSTVKTIYKEKKLGFSLKAGVRVKVR